MLNKILNECFNLKIISFSKYAFSRCNSEMLKSVPSGIKLKISCRNSGRPNSIEKFCPDSSLVEHQFGKLEVPSSILGQGFASVAQWQSDGPVKSKLVVLRNPLVEGSIPSRGFNVKTIKSKSLKYSK